MWLNFETMSSTCKTKSLRLSLQTLNAQVYYTDYFISSSAAAGSEPSLLTLWCFIVLSVTCYLSHLS